MAHVKLKQLFPEKEVRSRNNLNINKMCSPCPFCSYTLRIHIFVPPLQIAEVTEMSLSANQERAEMERKRLAWNAGNPSEEEPKVSRGGPVDPVSLLVELAPMEIRTFVVKFQYIRMHGV